MEDVSDISSYFRMVTLLTQTRKCNPSANISRGLTNDLSRKKLAHRLFLTWGTFAQILFSFAAPFFSLEPVWNTHAGRRTSMTHCVVYYDSHTIHNISNILNCSRGMQSPFQSTHKHNC